MSKKVLIIGGGVIGLCSAYYAAKRGHRVIILEREPAGHAGCSSGNAGMIVPSHFIPLAAPGMIAYGLKTMWNPESPFYIRPRLSAELLAWGWRFWRASTKERVERAAPVLRDLHFASRACFQEIAAETGNSFQLTKKGLLMLCKTQHALDDEAHVAEKANALGVPAEVLDAAKTAALDPGMSMSVAGSVYYPKDCHFSPENFLRALETELKKMNVEIIRGAEVTSWIARDGKIGAVKTGAGEFDADEFVLCGGVWSNQTAHGLGLNIPMQAGKGYSLMLENPRQLPQLCSILVEARVAVTPMNGRLRFGGTMELLGLSQRRKDAKNGTEINPVRVRGIVKSSLNYFPEFKAADFENVRVWSGLRPCSPDGLPYLGRTKRYKNLTVACGHAMMGMSLGPVTGKIVAEILSDEKPGLEIGLLSPERYG